MMRLRSYLLGSVVLLAAARPCVAQRAEVRFPAAPARLPVAESVSSASGGGAFLIEAAGGVAGSLAGFALVYSTSGSCDSEDLVCNLRHAGAAIAVSTAGAAAGVYIAGKFGKTQPSAVGALLGAIAGGAAGVGIWHLATEELDVVKSDTGAIITYGVTQGLVAALGSRLARAL